MDALLNDASLAFRQFRKRPGFALVAILTLGLGIGVNTLVFALVNRVLFQPLPFPDSQQMMVVWDVQPGYSGRPAVSVPEFRDWEREGDFFQALTGQMNAGANLRSAERVERVSILRITGDYLGVLGLEPALGRGFTRGELDASEPVAMVSETYWRTEFAGAPEVLGSVVELDGVPHTVIGVMPLEAARIANPTTIAWVPLSQVQLATPRGSHFLRVYGRLAPGVSHETARERTAVLATSLQESQGTTHGIEIQSLEELLVGRARVGLLFLLGVSLAVLFIICGNLATLFLARSAAREQEFAVRFALGGGGRRLGRQLLTEASLVGLLGGTLGLLLAVSFTQLTLAYSPDVVALTVEDWLDARVVAFTLLVALGAGLSFGALPARRLVARELALVLREGEGGRGGGSRKALKDRRTLVAVQLAFSVMLLTTSTLLVRSLVDVLDVDPGFDAQGVLAFRLAPPEGTYPDSGAVHLFYRELRNRLEGLPGVIRTSRGSHIPLTGDESNGGFSIVGRDWPEGQQPYVNKRVVGAGYFETLGMRILSGRGFTEEDGAGGPLVTVISEEMARTHWPDEDPVGARVNVWEGEAEVVGVVAEVGDGGLGSQPRFGTAYVPASQVRGWSNHWVVVKSSGDPLTVVGPVREVVRRLDPSLPLYSVNTMEQLVDRSLAERRVTANIFLALGLVGLLLAAVGVFGVTVHAVQQRTREIGVRMALGGEGRGMIWMVLLEESRALGTGMGAGLLMAMVVTRVISAGMYQVSAFDPLAFGSTLAVLGVVGLVAVYLPARRAARVDPISALRAD